MRLLITDLDNTLYDWVTYFAHAFDAMVEELSQVLDVERERLLAEFKTVHQRHHNIEQPFALFEIDSVQEQLGHLSREELFEALDGPLSAFREARDEKLRLYPGVEDTLRTLRGDGVLIVGHTEALAVQAASRLRRLGILEAFHHLYAIDHGDMPPHPRKDHHSRTAGGGRREHLITYLPDEDRKPNPDLLHDICRKEDVEHSTGQK
jgi:phosphoglycolate phosphatase